MNCRIGRLKECDLQGCFFKLLGDIDCKDYIEKPILPILKKPIKKVLPKKHSCYYCNKPLKASQVTKDHIFAKSLGGTSHSKNLVDSCKLCNTFKSNMTIELFILKLQTILNNTNKLKNK